MKIDLEIGRRKRFFEKVEFSQYGCWTWTGHRNSDGYGKMFLDKRQISAHRMSMLLKYGAIPSGKCVLHRCDNPPCVRPDHLFFGTIGENNSDRHRKGRTRGTFPSGKNHPAKSQTGEAHWCAKLSDLDVSEIRKLRKEGIFVTVLAKRFGVNTGTISRIGRGIWR